MLGAFPGMDEVLFSESSQSCEPMPDNFEISEEYSLLL